MINKLKKQYSNGNHSRLGFTLIEMLISSSIMLIVILGTLSLYMDSNRIAVDQQQFAELQNDVRSAMFFISRDLKSAGAGLPQQFCAYFIEGVNNDPAQPSTGVRSDRITILGNSDPAKLVIKSYVPSSGTITLEDYEFSLYPYTAGVYPSEALGYINRLILILPNPDLNTINGELGLITSIQGLGTASNIISFSSINETLPNGLIPGGAGAHYVGGTVHFIDFKTYWLDVDGNYQSLTAGTNGYLGQPGVLYVSRLVNNLVEYQPLAQNIEDFQFQYHGDFDNDQVLDDNNNNGQLDAGDFLNWNDSLYTWTDLQVLGGIRRIRIYVLGKTENPYVSVSSAVPPEAQYIYGKPYVADSLPGTQVDRHRRFLLESTANIRNMSLSIYNTGLI